MISIIITAYNAEKTIEKCLNSILDTQYNDYEIILVNDGSTDNTEKIIELFASDKIKYYKKANTGVADSRNFGIDKAKGDYITFVDSDDYVSSNYFEGIDKYINEGIDIIKRKGIIVNKNNQEKIKGDTFDITTGEDAFNKLCFTDIYLDTLWSYIIKKSLLIDNNLYFEKDRFHEDFGLLPLLILKANKIVSLDNYVYYYVQTDNSIMRENNIDKTIKKAKDALYHYDNILKTIEKYNLSNFTKENVRIYCTNAILLKVKELKGKEQKWYIKELKNRKVYKNIKVRNIKQLIKKGFLFINIKLYSKLS